MNTVTNKTTTAVHMLKQFVPVITATAVLIAFLSRVGIYFESNNATAAPFAATDGTKRTRSRSQSRRQSVFSDFIRKYAAEENDRVLNVHFVPHTHDDVGWRKTPEQYYYGYNNSIDTRGNVRAILTTAIESLLLNSERTFVYVEIKFFSMWWQEQNESVRDSVRMLLKNKQLVFVNGGWVMHDEACTHFVGMIDQTSTGHAFLKHELNVVPTIGWQLDPFGHSLTQASLLTARAGMNAVYFGRIDYQDLARRHLTQECEGLWKSASAEENENDAIDSDNNDESFDSTVFWGLTGSYEGNYGPPSGFSFDVQSGDEKLVGLNESELRERLHLFLQYIRVQSDRTKGNHIMLTMGTDFNYLAAQIYFANLDLLIGTVMMYQNWNQIDISTMFGPNYDRINLFYSTPEYYTQMKYQQTFQESKQFLGNHNKVLSTLSINTQQQQQSWTTKTDDFFPYADGEHNFWTGYFTSRTAFKRLERVASNVLLAARQIEAKFSSFQASQYCHSPLFPLEDALGVVQHHDAVAGTAKQHVADDYSKRVQAGIDTATTFSIQLLREAMIKSNGLTQNALSDLMYCQRLNESICEVSQKATKLNDTALYVIVYNPVASNVSTIVRLPVSSKGQYLVERITANNTQDKTIQMIDTIPVLTQLQKCCCSKDILAFDTGYLPPVGAASFKITQVRNKNDATGCYDKLTTNSLTIPFAQMNSGATTVTVTHNDYTVTFDKLTGMMQHVTASGVDLNITQSWGYYKSFDSKMDHADIGPGTATQSSGAYIFRPSTPDQKFVLLSPAIGSAKFLNTSVGVEVHIFFEEPWLKQVTRVLRGQPYVEVEYTVGPIPITDGRGKEIVTRYSTPIQSNGIVFTDSNGREFLKRRRNFRSTWSYETYEPVAGNYYPVNAAAYVEGNISASSRAALSVLVDRSQGGASLVDGSIELMVQRRTVVDDGRGVDEALNETAGGMTPYPPYGSAVRLGDGIIIRGTHRLMVGASGGAQLARSVMDRVFAQPLIFVGSAPIQHSIEFQKPSFSALQTSLPSNVMLVTFAKLHSPANNSYLIRLGHQYGTNEVTNEFSQPVQVDLATFFDGLKITDIREKTLTGNKDWNEFLIQRMNWSGRYTKYDNSSVTRRRQRKLQWKQQNAARDRDTQFSTIVSLKPMDIKTFHVAAVPLPIDRDVTNGDNDLHLST